MAFVSGFFHLSINHMTKSRNAFKHNVSYTTFITTNTIAPLYPPSHIWRADVASELSLLPIFLLKAHSPERSKIDNF